MPLGNSEAVREGNKQERRPTRPSPARETAERRAATPEREPERAPKPDPDAEWEATLRRSVPGITDEAVADLKAQFRKG